MMNVTLKEIKQSFPKLEWKISNDLMKVDFYANGKSRKDAEIETLLESSEYGVTVAQLRSSILEEAKREKAAEARKKDASKGEITFLDLPLLESREDSLTDLNSFDEQIWKDVKFVKGAHELFYVKDGSSANTYTTYLTAASSADRADIKTLREAFYSHNENRPEQIAKALLKDFDLNLLDQVPVTAWKYFKIRAYKKDKDVVWDKLIIPAGNPEKLYQGFIDYEADFRNNSRFLIEAPKPLTNDPKECAIAYLDLEALSRQYEGQTSELWDTFLIQRLHKPEYVSIFKAWTYAVAVGTNNSRQEMWLYGNGGTGKSCLCKSFIRGFNRLVGKDICLAASKDTGKSNFNSEILNKHLLVYPDAKNLRSGMSEFKHNVTGGDYSRIEGKGKTATSAFIYMKCLTCSNELPKVDMTDRSQSSRYIILPFTLDDAEMKKYGLMDDSGQIKGSSDFQERLDAEFDKFLASCKEHYEARCTTNSNIDAHEALGELSGIGLSEVSLMEDFIDTYFEITKDPDDKLTQKDFRKACLVGIEDMDAETGVKVYKNIDLESLRNFMERKYTFKWKQGRIGDVNTKIVASPLFGIKVRTQRASDVTASSDDEYSMDF